MEPGKEILKFEKSIKGMWKRLIESFRDTTVRKNIEKTAFFNISPHPRTQNLCVFAIRRASFSHKQISESKDTRMISPANFAKLWYVEITACRNYGTSKLRYVEIAACRISGMSKLRHVEITVRRNYGTFWIIFCRRIEIELSK